MTTITYSPIQLRPGEAAAMLMALDRWCTCGQTIDGLVVQQCEGHRAYFDPAQTFVKKLIFFRRLANRLEDEEGL